MHLQFEKSFGSNYELKKSESTKKELKEFGKKMTYKVPNGMDVDRCCLEIKSLSICIVYVISSNNYISSFQQMK